MNVAAPSAKHRRHRALLDIIATSAIGSQEELAERLRERGFDVTQATVSRDVAELGLVKLPRGDKHAYAGPQLGLSSAHDARLRRLLEDIPVRIGRSGLTLVLVATPGSAGAIAQAIDQSSLTDQVGTLAGDNTLLVLFEDEPALERWLGRFEALQPLDARTGWAAETTAAPAPAVAEPPFEPAAATPATTTATRASTGRALAQTEAPR